MHLFAALVPPREVLDDVVDLVARVEPPRSLPEPGPPGRHAAWPGRRFGRRKEPEVVVTLPRGPQLNLLSPFRMTIPVARFGNVALVDANRLVDGLRQQAATWQTPRLRLHGGTVLEPEGDDGAWANLAGDVDHLNTVKAGVIRAAQGLQLFVDRRVFRPHLRIGTINDLTTEAYLEELLSVLDDYEGPAWWQSTISLLVPAEQGPDGPAFRVHREIALGPQIAH
jgi:2'-5' RNA ligase